MSRCDASRDQVEPWHGVGLKDALGIAAADLITIGLLVVLEGLLSADNALVMAIMVLGLPKRGSPEGPAIRPRGRLRVPRRSRPCWPSTSSRVGMGEAAWRALPAVPHLLPLLGSRGRGGPLARTPKAATHWLGMRPFWSTVVESRADQPRLSRIDSILVAVAMSPRRG